MFISRAEKEADSLLGKNTVLVKIIHPIKEDEYNVRLLRVGDKDVDISAEIAIKDVQRLEYGDNVIVNGMIDRATDVYEPSKLIRVTACVDEPMFFSKEENKNYFSADGIIALSYSMREGFGAYIDGLFGESGAIVRGLLINDKTDIDGETKLAFKRSGTSHILAVSGLHISLLLGAVELLLRRLFVKKEIRIAIISLLALFLVALTAFSASAVRSVIMLYAVYVCYILFEENDPITSLFVAIAIIILFSPYSIYDLGMWMSFLATLGILTVYPVFEETMPYPKQENKLVRYTLRGLIWCAKAIMLTVVANFFILPIMWLFFGEASLSSVPCNLVLGPVITLLMPFCAVCAIFGWMGFFGDALVFLCKLLLDLMLWIVESFSKMRFGVISLSYDFAGVLISIFAVVMVILLVVRLKHKLLIFLPMVSFVIAFAICFSVFSVRATPELKYCRRFNNELAFVNYGAECSVVKLDGGGGFTYGAVLENMSKYATEIDEYFIVSPSENDAKIIEKLLENTVIRKIYLPKSVEYEEYLSSYEIFKCAEKYNIEIDVYDKQEKVEICNGVYFFYSESDGANIFSQSSRFYFLDGKTNYVIGEKLHTFSEGELYEATLPLE
jgi:ComEC/Rec2-related protein